MQLLPAVIQKFSKNIKKVRGGAQKLFTSTLVSPPDRLTSAHNHIFFYSSQPDNCSIVEEA